MMSSLWRVERTTPNTATKLEERSDGNLPPLPSGWSSKDRCEHLQIINNTKVLYTGPGQMDSDAASVRANHPIPPGIGVFYYEVAIVDKGEEGYIGIGLCGSAVPLNKLPGWERNSYGYHGDDGHGFRGSGTGQPFGPPFTTGDVIGCGVNFLDRTIFYTKNGVSLGVAFRDVRGLLYPVVGLRTQRECVDANFGTRPFMWDVNAYTEEKNTALWRKVLATPLPNQDALLSSLVLSYLKAHAYTETARVFAAATGGGGASVAEQEERAENGMLDAADDAAATVEWESMELRQRVRAMLLEGKIADVLALLREHFPGMLEANDAVLFQLQTQQFVEMVTRVPVEETMQFGQQVLARFDAVPEHRAALRDAFSLLAYPDPTTSPVADLLRPERRAPIADAVNRALLEFSTGDKESKLDRLVRQGQCVWRQLMANNYPGANMLRPESPTTS